APPRDGGDGPGGVTPNFQPATHVFVPSTRLRLAESSELVASTPTTTPTSTRAGPWLGLPVARVEDDALLRGEGWFMDDLAPLPHIAEAAVAAGAPVLHEAVGSNVASDRRFAYGDFAAALAGADLVVRRRFRHPRSSCTPVEGAGVICAWDATTGSVTAWSNFQGPFTL